MKISPYISVFPILATTLSANAQVNKLPEKPNIVIIYIDDLGYGDLGCYGHPQHRTPNIDKLAAGGMRFTDFYAGAAVSTPSRASLLTGCYPKRVDLHVSDKPPQQFRAVLGRACPKGLNPKEITIAEVLKEQGYATACIGKWHVGDQPEFLPTKQGFDYYYGLPYSNNMKKKPCVLPLIQQEKVIEAPVNQNTITQRYTYQTTQFIKKHANQAFFVYLPHTMVHLPLHASDDFRGKSANGLYGDALEEIDWSTGQIMHTLDSLNLTNKTLVIFSSDNGAERWLGKHSHGGSNEPLRGLKGETWEGGIRVPCLMHWPGIIPPGSTCSEVATLMDFLPTAAYIAQGKVPNDRIIDGKNIFPLMTNPNTKSPYEAFYYYEREQLQAVRSGRWKLHLPLQNRYIHFWNNETSSSPAMLFDLKSDPAETVNLIDQHPEIAQKLTLLAQKARNDLGDKDLPGKNCRPAAWVKNPDCLKKD